MGSALARLELGSLAVNAARVEPLLQTLVPLLLARLDLARLAELLILLEEPSVGLEAAWFANFEGFAVCFVSSSAHSVLLD